MQGPRRRRHRAPGGEARVWAGRDTGLDNEHIMRLVIIAEYFVKQEKLNFLFEERGSWKFNFTAQVFHLVNFMWTKYDIEKLSLLKYVDDIVLVDVIIRDLSLTNAWKLPSEINNAEEQVLTTYNPQDSLHMFKKYNQH